MGLTQEVEGAAERFSPFVVLRRSPTHRGRMASGVIASIFLDVPQPGPRAAGFADTAVDWHTT
jgi:hypothetical protein